MAQVTGFTADRMRAIENSTVTGGVIVGDDLVLTRFDGGEIVAGDVRGIQGVKGDIGEVSQADLDTAVAGFGIPPGTLLDFTGDTPPSSDWVIPTGQYAEIADNPILFALYATKYGPISGSQFRLPDLTGLFTVNKGADSWNNSLGLSGGSSEAVLVKHNHLQKGDFSTGSSGSHAHDEGALSNNSTGWLYRGDSDGPTYDSFTNAAPNPNPDPQATYGYAQPSTSIAGSNHSHNITLSGNTGDEGDISTNDNLPPYFVVVKILRLG